MRPYSAHEIQIIKERYVTDGARKIAEEIGRGVRNVRTKAWQLGIRKAVKCANSLAHCWTDEEDARLRRDWPMIVSRRELGKNANWLAKQMHLSVEQIRSRAATLGLRKTKLKNPEWSEEEVELLHSLTHLSTESVVRRFKKAGFDRSPGAIGVQRSRRNALVRDSSESYSAHGLAKLMGVSSPLVLKWINRGWLAAKPRTDAVDCNHGGIGDRWIIKPADVRELIYRHVSHIDITTCDKFWLVDLLYSEKTSRIADIQHSCGTRSEIAGGLSEHEVMA